ncbi:MAG: hypothetical protein H8E28_05260 [Anaerolineae bacterium]|nr:hypothetical protein [Anaerolineae bacterium]
MTTQWMLNTHGNPLGAVRHFADTIWQTLGIEKMLAPTNGHLDRTGPRILEHRAEIEHLNPFTPLMPINAAKLVPVLLEKTAPGKAAAMLRPCEMRTLVEMSKYESFALDGLLTICVDCLGTLPADEYRWRAERKGSTGELSQEALQFSRQGGIVRYRYRAACQVCISPEATLADINIGILGLPVRQAVLITIANSALVEKLNLFELAEAKFDAELLETHERVAARLVQRSENTRERIANGLGGLLPENVGALVEQLNNCGDCNTCMHVCPLCDIHYPQRDEQGHLIESEAMRWLISCAGCGMCEQACPQHLPLSIIFNHIQSQLADEFTYNAGMSFEHPLPMI